MDTCQSAIWICRHTGAVPARQKDCDLTHPDPNVWSNFDCGTLFVLFDVPVWPWDGLGLGEAGEASVLAASKDKAPAVRGLSAEQLAQALVDEMEQRAACLARLGDKGNAARYITHCGHILAIATRIGINRGLKKAKAYQRARGLLSLLTHMHGSSLTLSARRTIVYGLGVPQSVFRQTRSGQELLELCSRRSLAWHRGEAPCLEI